MLSKPDSTRRNGAGERSDSTVLAPAQLVPQGVEEAAFGETHQIDGVLGALAANFVADFQLEGLLAVDGEERDVGDASVRTITQESPRTTIGRSVSRWGQMGVTTIASTSGVRMGPLAARV